MPLSLTKLPILLMQSIISQLILTLKELDPLNYKVKLTHLMPEFINLKTPMPILTRQLLHLTKELLNSHKMLTSIEPKQLTSLVLYMLPKLLLHNLNKLMQHLQMILLIKTQQLLISLPISNLPVLKFKTLLLL